VHVRILKAAVKKTNNEKLCKKLSKFFGFNQNCTSKMDTLPDGLYAFLREYAKNLVPGRF
jgi:hypothetical protein